MRIHDILELTRPLIAVDVETTLRTHRIVELGFVVEYPDKRKPKEWCSYINPGEPIEPGATEIHGINDEMVAKAPRFHQIAANLATGFQNCDYCGYNIVFDMDVIQDEMDRSGVRWSFDGARLLDSYKLWGVAKKRRLVDAVEEYLGRKPTDQHRAAGDAKDALEVAIAQLQRHPDVLPADLQLLHDMCFNKNSNRIDKKGKFLWKDGRCVMGFGKHKEIWIEKVLERDRGYLEWIVRDDGFLSDAKKIASDALHGVFPTK